MSKTTHGTETLRPSSLITKKDYRSQLLQYVVGFGLSLALTLTAYSFVTNGAFQGWTLTFVLVALAIVQTLVQLLLFLHLLHEDEPRWKLLVFDFMLLVLTILVFGTLWIMNNLNYNMVDGHGNSQTTDEYIIRDEGFDD